MEKLDTLLRCYVLNIFVTLLVILYWSVQHIKITYRNFAKGDKRFIVLSPSASNSEEIDSLLQDLIDLAFSGRHKGISVWVLTQKLTSIAKPFGDNVALVVAFHSPSGVST